MMRKIYMDHAATAPLDPKVFKAMKPYLMKQFGNASSIHAFGTEAREALEKSREKLAALINAKPAEIVFTSGGTESDNLALKGFAFANRDKGNHIITTKIEHHAVLHPCEWLEKNGFEATYLPVDAHGLVSIADFESALTKKTALASVMHANNEIGTIEPIEELGDICRKNGVFLHTDAVQSFGKIDFDVEKLNIDMASFSSHKIYGPKGVGALYVREGTKLEPILHGGGHERGLRSGTENVAGIVGFVTAAEIAHKTMPKESARLEKLRDRLTKGILEIRGARLNGHPAKRLPNNVNACFRFVEGESLVLMLNEKGIAASTGSACSSKSLKPSHVLLAIGLKPEDAHGSLRLTLGKSNNPKHVSYVLKVLPDIVGKLRDMSPIKSERELEEAMRRASGHVERDAETPEQKEEIQSKAIDDLLAEPLERRGTAEAEPKEEKKPAKKHTYLRLTQETDEKINGKK